MSDSGAADLNGRIKALENVVSELQREIIELRQRAAVSEEAEARGRLGLAEGERRTVTVLFADVSGFTTLAERLDPEDCNAIMRETLGAVALAVTDEGGHVEKFIGDAVCALFGAPISYDDEPQRAARAALAMHRVLRDLAQRRPGLPPLTVHIGINTGPVIAGGVGDGSQFGVMGDTINTAARLMDAAASGQTFVSAATARRLRRGFELLDAGTLKLKGKADQIVTYELISRLEEEAPAPVLAAPFIGRETEMATIIGERRGVTVVTADAGMGKSRLLDEAAQALADEATVLRATAGGFDAIPLELAADAFAPLVEQLPAGDDRTVLDSLVDHDPDHVHGDLPRVVLALLENEAAKRRLVVMLDGVDTADASSLTLLRFLLPATAYSDVHWVLGTRPGSTVATTLAATAGDHRLVTLERISAERTAEILMALLPGAIDATTAARLAPRVAGNPEFCAEIAHALIEEGLVVEDRAGGWRVVGDLSNFALPGTLREMIEARIESLDTGARQVIQAAAVIGTRFDDKVLHSVVSLTEPVESALAELAAADLVRPPSGESAQWTFRAPIAQEVVYDSILKRRRPELHMRVAEAKLALAASDPSDVAEALAHHFAAAGDTSRASEYLALAARRAFSSHGFTAAESFATQAMALGSVKPPALVGVRAKARFLSGDVSGAIRDATDIAALDAEPRALHHATWVLLASEQPTTVEMAERVLASQGDHAYATAATAARAVALAATSGTVPASLGIEGTDMTESHVLLAEGLLALWRRDGTGAAETLRRAHEIAAATDHVLIALLADEARSEAFIEAGQPDRAVALAKVLTALAVEREDAPGLARVRVLEAEAAVGSGDAATAVSIAEAVLAEQAATMTTRARAISVVARAHAKTGNGDEARRWSASADTSAEGLWLGWRVRERSRVQ